MVKVLISRNLHSLIQQGATFLSRSDVRLFSVDSNDNLLRIHRQENVDLIITQIDMPGIDSEQVFSAIRGDKTLRTVPVIMVCTNSPGAIEKCARCGVSDVVLRPVNQRILLSRAQQFLALFTRESSRRSLSVEIELSLKGTIIPARTVDIGDSGVMVETEHAFAKGDRISCSFLLPEGPRIKNDAEVVTVIRSRDWSAASRYGIRFIDLPDDARQALRNFVNAQSRVAA